MEIQLMKGWLCDWYGICKKQDASWPAPCPFAGAVPVGAAPGSHGTGLLSADVAGMRVKFFPEVDCKGALWSTRKASIG